MDLIILFSPYFGVNKLRPINYVHCVLPLVNQNFEAKMPEVNMFNNDVIMIVSIIPMWTRLQIDCDDYVLLYGHESHKDSIDTNMHDCAH